MVIYGPQLLGVSRAIYYSPYITIWEQYELFLKPFKNKNYVVEYIGEYNMEIYRSNTCKRIMSPMATSFTCRHCQTRHKFVTFDSEFSSKRLKPNISESSIVPSMTKTEGKNINEDNGDIILAHSNDEHMRAVLEKVLPEASVEMLDLLVNQKQNMERDPKGRRWDKKNNVFVCRCGAEAEKTINSYATAKYLSSHQV